MNAWAFYYWANSVFPLVITSSIFPIYFNRSTEAAFGGEIITFLGMEFINTALYAYALSFSFLVIAIISPLLSGIADYSGRKKSFLIFFTICGALACSALFFFNGSNLALGISAFVLASIGFSGSHIFYNAYLPQIATSDKIDQLSAKGFSLGYLGSSILLIFCLIMIENPSWFFIEEKAALPTRMSFFLTGVWWIGFALVTFRYLPPAPYKKTISLQTAGLGFRELKIVWNEMKSLKDLRIFMLSFFLFSMGLQTVLYVAAMFGDKEMKLKKDELIITILIIQFVAIGGAYVFSWLCKKIGNITALTIALIIWTGICIIAYFINLPWHFYVLATVVGFVMGAIQSVSRSTFSKLLPERKDHNSFFSFYEITEKIAISIGVLCYGIIEEVTGSMRNSIFFLVVFFLAGLIVLQFISKRKSLEGENV